MNGSWKCVSYTEWNTIQLWKKKENLQGPPLPALKKGLKKCFGERDFVTRYYLFLSSVYNYLYLTIANHLLPHHLPYKSYFFTLSMALITKFNTPAHFNGYSELLLTRWSSFCTAHTKSRETVSGGAVSLRGEMAVCSGTEGTDQLLRKEEEWQGPRRDRTPRPTKEVFFPQTIKVGIRRK